MKISNQYVLREVAGNYVVVPVGKEAIRLNAIIHLNSVGAFIFEHLQEEDLTVKQIVDLVLDEYDIDEETANKDVLAFISKLEENKIL